METKVKRFTLDKRVWPVTKYIQIEIEGDVERCYSFDHYGTKQTSWVTLEHAENRLRDGKWKIYFPDEEGPFRFRQKGGFKDDTDYIECTKDQTFLVLETGERLPDSYFNLTYCQKMVKEGEWYEFFITEKQEPQTKEVEEWEYETSIGYYQS